MRRSSSGRMRCVPAIEAMTPPRSMSPTRMTGTLARVAKPILAMSRGRRLISAGEPAPSTMTRSAPSPTFAQEFQHGLHQLRLQRLVVARLGLAEHLALHDDLRADVALRLQQHRVHVDRRRDAAGDRLQPLRAADLAAAGSPGMSATAALFDMFCGLNGRTFMPRLLRGAAEPGDQHRLADIRAGALQHDRPRHASAPALRTCR